jgi:hypothetical protein
MPGLTDQARPAVEELLGEEPETLYAELESRRRLISLDPSQAGSFQPEGNPFESSEEIPAAQLREFGRRFFARVSEDMYKLVCGDAEENRSERHAIVEAMGGGNTTFAAVLAALLVSNFGWAPALAAVLSALTVKLFFNNAYAVACDLWKQSIKPAQNV